MEALGNDLFFFVLSPYGRTFFFFGGGALAACARSPECLSLVEATAVLWLNNTTFEDPCGLFSVSENERGDVNYKLSPVPPLISDPVFELPTNTPQLLGFAIATQQPVCRKMNV